MATLIRHRWTSTFEGMSRRDRQGCDYDAYLPDPIAGWELTLPADLVADLIATRRIRTPHSKPSTFESSAHVVAATLWWQLR